MKDKILDIRNDMLECAEANDVLGVKFQINKLDTLIYNLFTESGGKDIKTAFNDAEAEGFELGYAHSQNESNCESKLSAKEWMDSKGRYQQIGDSEGARIYKPTLQDMDQFASANKEDEKLFEWYGKESTYDDDGDVSNLEVGDWIMTKKGKVVQITRDDMPELPYTEIRRHATMYEHDHRETIK